MEGSGGYMSPFLCIVVLQAVHMEILTVTSKAHNGLNQHQEPPPPSAQPAGGDKALDGWALWPLSPAGGLKVALQVSAVPPECLITNSTFSKPLAWSQPTLHGSSLYRAEALPRRCLTPDPESRLGKSLTLTVLFLTMVA